ncbi:MAG: PKD domain-containing protein, partial [Bacteroidota bacterium]
ESFIQEVVIFDLDVEGAGNNLSIGGDITGLANVTIADREELFIVNASGNDVLVFDVVDEIQKDAIFVGNVPTAFGSFMSPHHQPPPPEVRFDYTVVGFEVHFNDRTQGEEASRTWRFGNGNQSDEMNPTELYAEAGTYVVTLTVTFESGAVNSYTRDILVQELPDARHLSVSVAKNSEDNHIDVMGKFGYNPTDHLISYTASGTTGAFRGTARAGMDSIIYTPNADYVGPDVVQYDICLRSNPDECETAYLYINVFDGNCAYVMNASSNWHHCPEACDNGGSSFPYGQPTPGQCWAYNFFFENTSNDPITLLDATLYVDDHMRIVEGSGTVDRDRSDVVPNVTVSFDEKNHRVKFSLPPGEVIEPHAIYSFYFRVDVLELPVNGRGTEYHSYMEGIAGCARGLGNLVNVPLDEAEGSACDPNEITVSPEGCGDGNAIDREVKTLTYTIEFENEGNGPATDVTVRDVLPDGLDLSTVHVVDGAPFMPQMTHNPFIDANELNFNFRNINLPPASEDSLGSRGFVKFTVDIEDGLPDGTEIRNSASIFFDAQIPVRTDTTLTTVETAPAPISNLKADTTLLNGDFPCYPLNPAPTGGSGNYKYQWNVGFRVPQLTLCPFATGYIEVVITDTETGCQTADRHNYTFVDSLISSTVEPTLAKPMQVVVAPNPFREFTDIQVSGEENAEIVLEVFNSVGQRVRELYRGPILSGETRNFRFEGDGLSNGMYYYRLQSREGLRQTGKMVLLR